MSKFVCPSVFIFFLALSYYSYSMLVVYLFIVVQSRLANYKLPSTSEICSCSLIEYNQQFPSLLLLLCIFC